MKRTILLLTVVAVLMGATSAFAEVKTTLSVKSWYNWWEHTIDYTDGTSDSWDNGSSFMVKAFLGASYLKSTSNYEASDWSTAGDKMEFDRADTDLTLGVMFTQYFGAFVGYKKIEADMTYYDTTGAHFPFHDGTWEISGPGLGILGNIPLGQSAALYGNFALLSVEQEFQDNIGGTTPSFDMIGTSFELGSAFAFNEWLSANLGFKYQSFWGDDSSGDDHTQEFYGITLGLGATF